MTDTELTTSIERIELARTLNRELQFLREARQVFESIGGSQGVINCDVRPIDRPVLYCTIPITSHILQVLVNDLKDRETMLQQTFEAL